jgi:uncharacterized protein
VLKGVPQSVVQRSRAWQLGLALVASVLACAALGAAADAIPPAPTRWVTDNADFMSEGARAALDGRLEAYEKQTGHQVIVWIGRTTGGLSLEDFATRALRKWGVGRAGKEDGLILFIFADDRRMRIETGYGLEEHVPDVIGARILNDTIVPRLQAGDRDGAVAAGIEAAIGAIEGQPGAPQASSGSPTAGAPDAQRAARRGGRGASLGQMVLFGILGIVFLFILVTNPRLALWILFNVLLSGRGGGGFGGSGGGSSFSGGGGRSGGGGASSSW